MQSLTMSKLLHQLTNNDLDFTSEYVELPVVGIKSYGLRDRVCTATSLLDVTRSFHNIANLKSVCLPDGTSFLRSMGKLPFLEEVEGELPRFCENQYINGSFFNDPNRAPGELKLIYSQTAVFGAHYNDDLEYVAGVVCGHVWRHDPVARTSNRISLHLDRGDQKEIVDLDTKDITTIRTYGLLGAEEEVCCTVIFGMTPTGERPAVKEHGVICTINAFGNDEDINCLIKALSSGSSTITISENGIKWEGVERELVPPESLSAVVVDTTSELFEHEFTPEERDVVFTNLEALQKSMSENGVLKEATSARFWEHRELPSDGGALSVHLVNLETLHSLGLMKNKLGHLELNLFIKPAETIECLVQLEEVGDCAAMWESISKAHGTWRQLPHEVRDRLVDKRATILIEKEDTFGGSAPFFIHPHRCAYVTIIGYVEKNTIVVMVVGGVAPDDKFWIELTDVIDVHSGIETLVKAFQTVKSYELLKNDDGTLNRYEFTLKK